MQLTKFGLVWVGFTAGTVAAALVGCGSDDHDNGNRGGGASAASSPSGGSATTSSAGGATTAAMGGATTTASAGSSDVSGGSTATDASGAAGATNAIPLPPGSRDFNHIVNLVDAEATAEVEGVLRTATGVGLPLSTQLFLKYYLDEYDFLFFVTDHAVASATAAAAFCPVYRPAQAATGDKVSYDYRQQHGSARALGVIGVDGSGEPPLEHEIAHYWAAHLDKSFGFGKDAATDYGSHWGITSVHGQLGGFDAASLACANPAGAVPPDCVAEPNGHYRYTVAGFYPYVNRTVNYAPLELYLMGLLPAAEVPATFLRIDGVDFSASSYDAATSKSTIEGTGTTSIQFADILKFHGEVPLKAANQRAFTSAFVVVSSSPASDAAMTNISKWQEVFGSYVVGTGLNRSFAERTGNRAAITSRLGQRRTPTDPIPDPPALAACSVTLQDCGDGLGCYGSATRKCAIAGTLAIGQACTQNSDCVPGAGCPNQLKQCVAYCDPSNATATKACATFCTAGVTQLVDSAGALTGAYCSLN